MTAIGDAKYKDILQLALVDGADRLDDPKSYTARICAADWNQLYVYLRLAGAAIGFFVVPYWNSSKDPAQLLDPPAFTYSPLDGNAPTQVKVLGLNLLRPIGAVRREGAHLLAGWLRQSRAQG